jgi:hypothetical protein
MSWIWISNFVPLLSIDSSRRRLRNQVISFFVWLWWVIDLVRFEFKSGMVHLFYLYLCFVGQSCLLVSWCAGGRCSTTCTDEDRGRSRRPDAEDRGWSHRSGTRWPSDREVGWRRIRSTLCTWRRGARVSWLSLKTRWWRVSHFIDLDLKITATVSCFGPQNQACFDLSDAPQNRWEGDDVGHMSRSSGLLHLEASLARVS